MSKLPTLSQFSGGSQVVATVENLQAYHSELAEHINFLQRESEYSKDDTIEYDNLTLKCITAGTTSQTKLNVSSKKVGDTITDGTVTWKVVAKNKGFVSVWATNTAYELFEFVMKNNNLYICISAHTSTDFVLDADKWLPLSGTSGGSGSNNTSQVTKMNITAPYSFDITIPNTVLFNLPAVEVLKLTQGISNSTVNLLTFSAGNGENFNVGEENAKDSPLVEFDGTAHPSHNIVYSFGNNTVKMQDKYYFESETIDFNDYKTVSELLGHANVNITLNLYVHPRLSQKKKCIDMICKVFQESV